MSEEDCGESLGWEYVVQTTNRVGETVFDTRHDAIGHATILGRFMPEERELEVFARRETRSPMTDDALWRAEIIDKSGESWESLGFTFLYDVRSHAKDVAYLYMLANHVEEASVSTMPWYGSEYEQIGTFDVGDGYPVYRGYSEGEAIDSSANALQYESIISELGFTVAGGGESA